MLDSSSPISWIKHVHFFVLVTLSLCSIGYENIIYQSFKKYVANPSFKSSPPKNMLGLVGMVTHLCPLTLTHERFMVCEIDANYRPCIQVQIEINLNHRFMSRLHIEQCANKENICSNQNSTFASPISSWQWLHFNPTWTKSRRLLWLSAEVHLILVGTKTGSWEDPLPRSDLPCWTFRLDALSIAGLIKPPVLELLADPSFKSGPPKNIDWPVYTSSGRTTWEEDPLVFSNPLLSLLAAGMGIKRPASWSQ